MSLTLKLRLAADIRLDPRVTMSSSRYFSLGLMSEEEELSEVATEVLLVLGEL